MDLKPHKLSSNDYGVIAKLHCDHINKGFLASMGIPFLTLLYQAIDKDSESVLLVERVNSEVIGFVAGARGLGRIYKQLLLHPLQLIFALKIHLLTPAKIYKILEILTISKGKNSLIDLPKEELLSIVVSPNHQGRGNAENLFKALCSYFSSKGADSFKIVVGSDLDRAHAFYAKMGGVPVKKTQVHNGVDSIIYTKSVIT